MLCSSFCGARSAEFWKEPLQTKRAYSSVSTIVFSTLFLSLVGLLTNKGRIEALANFTKKIVVEIKTNQFVLVRENYCIQR